MPSQSPSELIESVTVDAYGIEEQLTAFLVDFGDEVTLPCRVKVPESDVEVIGFDIEGDERRGLGACCWRAGGRPGVVALADARFEPGTAAAWLHAAFRTWLGLEAFPARRSAPWSWPER